jgi:hypothetical protein
MKSPEEKTKRVNPEVSSALKFVRDVGLFKKGLWIKTIIDTIFEHPNPKEIAGAIILLSYYLPKPMVNIQETDGLCTDLIQLFDAFKKHDHPLLLVAAYALLLPFETYPYQVFISAETVTPEHNKIYAYNQDGFVIYEFLTSEKILMRVNSDIVFDTHQHRLKLKILNDAVKRGYISYHLKQESNFLFYHLLETPLPLSYAIAMSHVMNLPLWKDESYSRLCFNVSYFMRFWIQDVHFLEPFINLTPEVMTDTFFSSLCATSKELDSLSDGVNKFLILKDISEQLSTKRPQKSKFLCSNFFEDEKRSEDLTDEASVYLNIFIQRAAFLKVLTRDVKLLMDFKAIGFEDFFEIPDLFNLKPEI